MDCENVPRDTVIVAGAPVGRPDTETRMDGPPMMMSVDTTPAPFALTPIARILSPVPTATEGVLSGLTAGIGPLRNVHTGRPVVADVEETAVVVLPM